MRTKIIGLTGGIGSGKSTIAGYFASKGVPLYIADDEAKKILYRPEVVKEIGEAFGTEIMHEGLPDKAKLAAVVFNNTHKLAILNNIIHPRVAQHFKDWVKSNTGSIFVIKEAAILFESGSYKDCDRIVLVTAPEEIRIQRVIKRDNSTRQEVVKRMSNQWSDEQKKLLSDYVIDNSDLGQAKKQADEILEFLKNINN